jgi:hypothetical protein
VTQSDKRLLSLTFLSFGVLNAFGNLSSAALVSVLASLVLALMSLSRAALVPRLNRWSGTALVLVLAATEVLYNGRFLHSTFLLTFAVLAAAILLYTFVPATAAKIVAALLAAGSVVAGAVTNISWGFTARGDDVFHFQQDASQALLHGANPYTPVVPSLNIVPPGIARWIPLHFPYGPVLPVLEAPFRLLGDIRILHLAAAGVSSAAVVLLARRAKTLDRSVVVAMAFPLTIGMVVSSWVDIIMMAALAVWFVLFRSHPRVATVALVIALATKPTTLIALVPIFFWSVRARRQMLIAGGIAAAFVLPFALVTGLSQFYFNVLGVQLNVLPRLDALTVNSYLHAIGLPILPFAVSAVVIAVTAVLVLRRRPQTYGELLTGTAVLATVSFLVAKWAYFNYYYIPAVLLMLAIAGDNLALDSAELIRPPALLLAVVDGVRGALVRLPGSRRLPGALLPQTGRGTQPEAG